METGIFANVCAAHNCLKPHWKDGWCAAHWYAHTTRLRLEPELQNRPESLVICELDGTKAEVDHLIERVYGIARDKGATFLKVSESEEERLQFWAGRKNAFPAAKPAE